jgi:PAS domain S-box-containing protein
MSTNSNGANLDAEIVSQLLRDVSSSLLQVDGQGKIVAWTKENERMFGAPAENVLNHVTVLDLFATRSQGEELLSKLREGRQVEVTADMVKLSGGGFPAKLLFAASPGNDRYLGICTDVSDREQARENFNYLKVYLDTVLEISGDAIITSDLDGVIMMFNEGAEAIFRREALDALGEDMFALLFSKEDIPEVKAALRDSGHIRDRESGITVGADEEEVFLEVTISKTRDARGQETALVALIRDITTRKRLEEERLANERVQHEMRIARGVQLTMLPDRPPKVEAADIAARIEFCEDIGGDLFDFSHPRSGKLGVSIGDVSAHGVGPAIVMSSAKAMLNTLEQYTEDLEHMFFLLNNLLEKTTEDDRFITMFYGLIDLERKTMEYVNAGHDPPIVYRPSTGVFEELQSTGMLLGILPSERFRLGDIVQFNAGDLLLLTTDGIWEAADDDGGAFGKNRVFDILRDLHTQPAQAILDELFLRVSDHCGGQPARDDQTAVLFKFR